MARQPTGFSAHFALATAVFARSSPRNWRVQTTHRPVRSLLVVVIVLILSGCADPREEKLLHNPGCNVPFGTAASARVPVTDSVSELVVCASDPWGPAGFVTVKGPGRRSAYGDTHDPFAPNSLPDPAGCAGEVGVPSASRAFWAEVSAELRDRSIVVIGTGVHQACGGDSVAPELLALRLVDWADLDAAVALVQAAMRAHDICSPIALEIGGVRCGTSL